MDARVALEEKTFLGSKDAAADVVQRVEVLADLGGGGRGRGGERGKGGERRRGRERGRGRVSEIWI